MKLSILIENLNQLYKKYGDLVVCVKYRDEDGELEWTDELIYLKADNEKEYEKEISWSEYEKPDKLLL